MQTTQLYVELIIIGLQGSVGLSIAYACIFGREQFISLLTFVNSAPMIIIVVGFLYILGLTIDRLADMIFQGWENNFRKLSGLQTKSTLVLLKNADQMTYIEITRNKSRILRASILTSAFALVTASFFIFTQSMENKVGIALFTGFLGLFFVFTSIFGYRKMLKKYYDRARVIEMELTKN